jgi:hypothetical protein
MVPFQCKDQTGPQCRIVTQEYPTKCVQQQRVHDIVQEDRGANRTLVLKRPVNLLRQYPRKKRKPATIVPKIRSGKVLSRVQIPQGSH